MERQIHGFIFEEKYIKENNLVKESNYTSSFDAHKDGVMYQIKLIKKGSSIDLGDIFRNSNKKEDFYLIIGLWEINKTNIVSIYELYIDYLKWNKLLEFKYYTSLKHWIQNVSNTVEYDDRWKK